MIRQNEREQIHRHTEPLRQFILTPEVMAYVFTKIIHDYIEFVGLKSCRTTDVIGVLERVKLEFYRTVGARLADEKRKEYGPISKLDAEPY